MPTLKMVAPANKWETGKQGNEQRTQEPACQDSNPSHSTRCATPGKVLDHAVPQFPHLQNRVTSVPSS